MRILKIAISIAVITLFTACSNKNKPEDKAQEFLNAYLSTDFNSAAALCTPELEQKFVKAIESVKNLDDSLMKHVQLSAAQYTPIVDSLIAIGEGDTTLVLYSIIKKEADSTAARENLIESTLTLVKNSNKEWVVSKLGSDL